MIIPYCDVLSTVFKNLIDENYVKTKSGHVDFSKSTTISTALRVLAAEYLKSIFMEGTIGSTLFRSCPRIIIIPSSAPQLESKYAYSLTSEIESDDIEIDPLQLEKFSTALLRDLSNYHPDIVGTLGEFTNYYSVIWIDERFSFIENVLTSHFLPPSSYQTIDKGKFIVDTVDYPVEYRSPEHFRIESMSKDHILYRAVRSKLF